MLTPMGCSVSNPFLFWQEESQTSRLIQEIDMTWKVKTHSGAQQIYNYAAHILRPKNTESGESELNNIREKYQYKNELILHKTIINARWNQIADMMQGFAPLLQDS